MPKNDSHIALSKQSPAVPIEGCTPALAAASSEGNRCGLARLVRVMDYDLLASLQQRHVELACELFRRTSGLHQLDHVGPEFRWVWGTMPAHSDTS